MNSILNVEESNFTLTGVFHSEVISCNEPTKSSFEYKTSFLLFFVDGTVIGQVASRDEPIKSNFKYTASFLRFFGDGTVISAPVVFPNLDIMSLWQNSMSKWFNSEYARNASRKDSAKYTLTDKKIEFSAGSDSEGFTFFYSGNYNEDELTLAVCPECASWRDYGRTYTYKRLTSS
jgi:hypothetical protein